ncbi:MAG: EAL domain-containing protein [Pseudomonadota bacterium]|nr:EAL domain-containing protein [Pseudomonadota bacterium]
MLIETDLSGTTEYASGATATLGEPPIESTTCHLADRFDRTSRPIIAALLKSVRPGRRIGPVRVTLNGREAKLSGWTLGDDHKIRWTVCFEALTAPEGVDPQAFERSAGEAISAARAAGEPLSMSVMRIEGIDDLDRQIGPDRASQVQDAISAACDLVVGELGVARHVDNSRTALIHEASADLAELKREIEDLLSENSLEDAVVLIDTVPDAPELEPDIAVQAFIHAVNQAADTDAALDIRSLKDAAAEMLEATTQRMKELRTTIAGRVIEPHAQPIIDLATGDIHHYELLLRLPGGRPIPEAVGFAESTGLIYEIDFAMTEIAATFLRDDFDRPALAVNLSGKSLANTTWSKRFLKMLADIKIDRSRLSFELTETATIKNIKAANAVIQKIRERGHKVCLDDFGAGAAGFHYLRDFPADIVKIDGSYIKRVGKSDRDTAILESMVDLCTKLGAETVAEMIEDESHAKLMKSLGVTYGQGYYFGKPVPLKTLTDPRNRATKAA